MAMSAANQVSVSQAWLSLRHCFQLTTPEAHSEVRLFATSFATGGTRWQACPGAVHAAPQLPSGDAPQPPQHPSHPTHAPVTSRMERPVRAAATALMPMEPPKIQRPMVMAKAKAVSFSSVLMGPSLDSSSRACALRHGAGGSGHCAAEQLQAHWCCNVMTAHLGGGIRRVLDLRREQHIQEGGREQQAHRAGQQAGQRPGACGRAQEGCVTLPRALVQQAGWHTSKQFSRINVCKCL